MTQRREKPTPPEAKEVVDQPGDAPTAGGGEATDLVTGAATGPGEPLPPVDQQGPGDEPPPTATAYETGEHLVYVRTATSGKHGVPVHPHSDVPLDALPDAVETLENLGLITRKSA